MHNLATGDAKMNMWRGGQASRGCEEISSCLLKFIQNLPTTVKSIIVFSDNAGGQNKCRLIVKFWLYVVRNTPIKTVDLKFLISRHSFVEFDKNFGVTEKAKKLCGK
ncbi:hypothetical protein PR048_028742 [Dryococelus australis]|uniref:DUF7869 domain-containing protein n=1 Tax=Dryococelus australis TaxID=614101 RepID=A0ABQ9GBE4_9NEOP|nr:hypothetical protein PR048_028742 [Dryococelus australis]